MNGVKRTVAVRTSTGLSTNGFLQTRLSPRARDFPSPFVLSLSKDERSERIPVFPFVLACPQG